MSAKEDLERQYEVARKDSEPWYSGYLLQGLVVLGVSPIIFPIIVAKYAGPAHVGLVVAAFYVGQIISPLLGNLADRTRRYRAFFLSGFILLALGLTGFVLSRNTAMWSLFAFIAGAGAGVSNTVSYSFIVEFRPEKQWDERLGWLQTFYGTGQAMGLLVATFVQSHAEVGLWIAAGLMLPGFLLGSIHLPKATRKKGDTGKHEAHTHNVAAMGPGRTPASLLRHYEHLTYGKLKDVKKEWFSFFGLFLLSWFLLMLGTWIIYNLYPLLMKSAFHIGAGTSSLYYAIAAFIGIFFYALSGSWSTKYGADKVVLLGAIMTLFSIGGMALLLLAGTGIQKWVVPPVFIVLPIAWSPLIVAGTSLAGGLTTIPQGTAMGLFNACTALASVLAAVVAGAVAQWFSYGMTCVVAAVLTVLAVLLYMPILKHYKKPAAKKESGAKAAA